MAIKKDFLDRYQFYPYSWKKLLPKYFYNSMELCSLQLWYLIQVFIHSFAKIPHTNSHLTLKNPFGNCSGSLRTASYYLVFRKWSVDVWSFFWSKLFSKALYYQKLVEIAKDKCFSRTLKFHSRNIFNFFISIYYWKTTFLFLHSYVFPNEILKNESMCILYSPGSYMGLGERHS